MSRTKLFTLAPYVFFLALIGVRCLGPNLLIFDEVHYVPAAKKLILLEDNLNWEHPPLGKLIFGGVWKILSGTTRIVAPNAPIPELFFFRITSTFFGLLTLFSMNRLLGKLGFSPRLAQAAVWMTGFGFLFFVMAKIAMLDMIYVGFCTLALALAFESRSLYAGIALGLGIATKWAALMYFPLIGLLLFLARPTAPAFLKNLSLLLITTFAAYALAWTPLIFLAQNRILPDQLWAHHLKMVDAQTLVSTFSHPYQSSVWQWPLLFRPMWLWFEQTGVKAQGVWAGGNPLVHLIFFPVFLFATVYTVKSFWKKKYSAAYPTTITPLVLIAAYLSPLIFWALVPRKLQLFYYFLPASIWMGPILLWALAYYRGHSLGQLSGHFGGKKNKKIPPYLIVGLTAITGVLFFYYLPILDGRTIAVDRYRVLMWFKQWI